MNKRAKTHSSQWDRFLDFAEKNSVVLTKKIEGPFGKNKYDELWKELTISLNSMGYVEKTTEKWQKAVADWKGKVRTKAAGIKVELTKTGGGGPVGPQLTETEKRLIGVMGWCSIRGDGTLELGSPTTSILPDNQIGMEHSYQFQVQPSSSKNVTLSPPPLITLSEKNNLNQIILPDIPEASNRPVPVETPSRKRKFIKKTPNTIRQGNSNLEKMHEDTMGILREINSNIQKLGNTQERMCDIHSKLLDILSTPEDKP